jgi:hypothetical protein
MFFLVGIDSLLSDLILAVKTLIFLSENIGKSRRRGRIAKIDSLKGN